jgi:hypothetical protein
MLHFRTQLNRKLLYSIALALVAALFFTQKTLAMQSVTVIGNDDDAPAQYVPQELPESHGLTQPLIQQSQEKKNIFDREATLIKAPETLAERMSLVHKQMRVRRFIDERTFLSDKKDMIFALDGLVFPYEGDIQKKIQQQAHQFLDTYFKSSVTSFYQSKMRAGHSIHNKAIENTADQKIQMQASGRLNRFGHHIGHLVRNDGLWAQGSLIANGLAVAYPSALSPAMARELYTLENDARENKKGLWADPRHRIYDASETTLIPLDQFGIIEGRPQKIAAQNGHIFVNFGDQWKTDFTIMIEKESRVPLARQNLNPQEWIGSLIRVRGWVEEFNGPLIRLIDTSQVEILAPPE